MKILLWAPDFFGYELQIRNALISMGNQVDLIHDRPFKSSFMRAISSRAPIFMSYLLTLYYKKKLRTISHDFDYILVINGQTLSPYIFEYIKTRNSNAKKILYIWDSLTNRSNVERIISKFDKVLSFDLDDCKKYGLSYRPLFYSPVFNHNSEPVYSQKNKKNLTIGFIGTIHTDRLEIISKFSQQNEEIFFKKYLYLHHPWVYIFNYLNNQYFRSFGINYFKYSSLSLLECAEFFYNCDAILDIEHFHQSGLTMRTLECIGLNKRLITTNQSVVNHEFYNTDSVHIIDRHSPAISEYFLKKKFSGYSEEIRYKYSLDGWIQEVFGFEL